MEQPDVEMKGPDEPIRNQGNEADKKENLPFIEKYRPNTLSEIISHEKIIATIKKFIEKNSLPHLLFHGPPGTGKTSCIFALAKEIFGDAYKTLVLEMNASDDRGINVVRDKIISFCSSTNSLSNMLRGTQKDLGYLERNLKLVILDEADMMTSAAQFALRRIIEKYNKNVRFCIICNNVQKIIPAIQSRCMRFRFCPLKKEQCLTRVKQILGYENIHYDNDNTLLKAIEIGNGDMRNILNLLESTFMSYRKITINGIYTSSGLPSDEDVDKIINIASDKMKSFNDAYKEIEEILAKRSFETGDIIASLTKNIGNNNVININAKKNAFIELAKLDYLQRIGGNSKCCLFAIVSLLRITF